MTLGSVLGVFLIYYKLNKKIFESHRVTESGGNSPMEKETSSLVSLGIVLIAIAVVITLGFGIFAVGKRLANNGQNDLVSQVDQINQSTFTDLDQQIITGTRLKGVINTLSSGNYAVLLNTLALRNSYIDGAKVTGDLSTSTSSYDNCFVISNLPKQSSKGTGTNACTWFVNYNALLGDAKDNKATVKAAAGVGGASKAYISFNGGEAATTAGTTTITGGSPYKNLVAFSDTLADEDGAGKRLLKIKDGVYTTQYEFQADSLGNVIKNIRQSDFNKQGTTMYIADAAQFNSYCIKDSTDNYVGLAFVQIQK